jgi:hypothetical protein
MPVIKSAIVVLRDDNDALIRVTNLNNYHPASSKRRQYRTETNAEQKQMQNRNSLHYVPPKYNKRFIVV